MLANREIRFIRYTAVGVSTFTVDLALLYLFIDIFKINYLISTAVAFSITVSINYFISRNWVFKNTNRSLINGYIYYLKFALIGIFITTILMWGITQYTGWHYITVRIIIAGIVGMVNYLANLYLNFKVVGKELN